MRLFKQPTQLRLYLLLSVYILITLTSALPRNPYGGASLQRILKEVLDPIIRNYDQNAGSKTSTEQLARDPYNDFWSRRISNANSTTNAIDSAYKSLLRRRCANFLACEHHIPVVEVQNAIFYAGKLYLHEPDADSLNAISQLNSIFGSRKNHLPVSLTSGMNGNGNSEWLPGPQIVVYSTDKSNGKYIFPSEKEKIHVPTRCGQVWDTSAFFLFPWEVSNPYHALNDNVLSVLASVVLQYITDVTHSRAPTAKHAPTRPSHYTLFKFKHKDPHTPLMQLLHLLFDGDVRSAREVLSPTKAASWREEPIAHCVRRVAWGSAAKPFYVDGLGELRRVLYGILRRSMALKFGEQLISSHDFGLSVSGNELPPATRSSQLLLRNSEAISSASVRATRNAGLRVVLVSRNLDASGAQNLARAMDTASELALTRAFSMSSQVTEVTRCCKFATLKTIDALVPIFGNADICLGVHGAGLSNCLLGPPGMLILELQAKRFPYFGFDSFMKLAHMSSGTHICYISSNIGSNGMLLRAEEVTDIVQTALQVAKDPKKGIGLLPESGILHYVAPGGTTLLVTPSPRTQHLAYLSPVDVLGPLGLKAGSVESSQRASKSLANIEQMTANAVPYYCAKGLTSPLSFVDACQKLPYYSFRRYTSQLVRSSQAVTCDQGKIKRKVNPESQNKPFSVLIAPHLE